MSLQISPRTSDIGFPVRRLLPSRLLQRVGPFIFVDHMGPDFAHYPASDIPETQIPGGTLRVLIGSALGLESPVRAHSLTTFLDLQLKAGAQFALHCPGQELAVYLAEGEATVNAQLLPGFHLQIEGDALQLQAGPTGCRAIVLGGEPLAGQRHVHWNFVSSSLEKVKQAGLDWQAQRFTLVPGETDWIPLPGL